MKCIAGIMTLVVVSWGAVGTVGAAEEPFTRVRPYNLSSHLPEFFNDLLLKRVWVFKRRGAVAALYFGAKGELWGCWLSRDRTRYVASRPGLRWKIGTPNGRSNLEISWGTAEGLKYYRMVVLYDGLTGRFHGERFRTRDRRWWVARDGWLQNEWPRVLSTKCGGLLLPWDVSLDDRQGSPDFEKVKAVASPVKKHPGWERSFPGAVGLGAEGGKPSLSLEQMNKARLKAHGKISIGMSGERRVVVAWPTYTEVWWVDNRDNIVDLAITRRVGDGSVVVVRWEKTGKVNSYHIGYAFPMVVTEKKHSAFRMMEAVAGAAAPVELGGKGLAKGSYSFSADGEVRGPAGVGKWWLSRGSVFLKLGEEEIDFPWKTFARLSGWSGG